MLGDFVFILIFVAKVDDFLVIDFMFDKNLFSYRRIARRLPCLSDFDNNGVH